jgi:hypothetical protein
VIFRHRRTIVWSALVLVVMAAVFALPVFGELGNENDFDDPSAEAVTARNAVTDATGAFAAPSVVALVRLGAPVESAQARERIRASPRSLPTGAAATAGSSPATGARPTCWRRSRRTPRGRGRTSSSGSRACPT